MKIGIANDHRGIETKHKLTKYLTDKGYTVVNYGTNGEGSPVKIFRKKRKKIRIGELALWLWK